MVAILCNGLAVVALLFLLWNPVANLGIALTVLIPAAILLYGTAFVRWYASRGGSDAAD